MARANNGGWDFVKVGGVYQYKEDFAILVVKVLEDDSDDKYYRFNLKVLASTHNITDTFPIEHAKDVPGYWSGMLQLYEHPEYIAHYKHIFDKEAFEASKFFQKIKGVPEDGSQS